MELAPELSSTLPPLFPTWRESNGPLPSGCTCETWVGFSLPFCDLLTNHHPFPPSPLKTFPILDAALRESPLGSCTLMSFLFRRFSLSRPPRNRGSFDTVVFFSRLTRLSFLLKGWLDLTLPLGSSSSIFYLACRNSCLTFFLVFF